MLTEFEKPSDRTVPLESSVAEESATRDDEAKSPPKQKSDGGFVDRWWHGRIWLGFSFGDWMRFLWHHRFAVSPHRIPSAIIITIVSLGHSFFRLMQQIIYGRRIARTQIVDGPVFIIGHWRSGTTMLHEILGRDERFAYPTNYQCFAPHHFLLTQWIIARWFGFLLPSQRPMDSMLVDWNRPQEDEFALCVLGERSPYWKLAFSNRDQCQEYIDLKNVPPAALQRWKRTLLRFVKLLTFHYRGKPIILKSPTHTGRVKVLMDLFPRARFIHIVRDPCVLYPSTVNMWKKMYAWQQMQTPRFEGLEEFVYQTFEQMYAAFEEARPLLPKNRLYEIRYEDLVRDPLGNLRAMYDQLELGDFDAALPAIEKYVEEISDYKPNRYEISPELRAEIHRRWSRYAEQYGYTES